MLLLARLAALSVAIAVLVLFVLPGLVDGPEMRKRSNDPPPGVKIAKNTSWGERALDPEAVPPAQEKMPVPARTTSPLANTPEEVKRFVSIEKGHAIEIEPPRRKRYYRVIVQDAGTLKTGNHIIRLKGITVRDEDETCEDANGESWPCGSRARTALTQLIRGRAVVCDLPPGGDRPAFSTRCRIGKTDLSLWMVEQGWAKPATEHNDKMARARDKAKQAQLGLWGGASQFRDVPAFDAPAPVFEQEPIYQESEPIYDQ